MNAGFSQLIVAATAFAWGLSPTELRSRTTAWRIARPRQAAAWLIRRLTGNTYARIAWRLGLSDHATVFHGIKKVAARRDADAAFAVRLDAVGDLAHALDRYVVRAAGPAHAFRILNDLAATLPGPGPWTGTDGAQTLRQMPSLQMLTDMGERLRLPHDPRWADALIPILPPLRTLSSAPPNAATATAPKTPPAPPLLAYIAAHPVSEAA